MLFRTSASLALVAMEEKLSSSSSSLPPRRSALTHHAAPVSALEARLAAQATQAAALASAAYPADGASSSSSASLSSHLPSSSGVTPLRAATAAAIGTAELNPLDWADAQFKRAGVTTQFHHHHSHHPPSMQSLGMQQRLRHAQLFQVVDQLREGQQHIFLEQFNQFPNVESHTADDYSRIWHAFKQKDEEAQHIIAKVGRLRDNHNQDAACKANALVV